MHATQPQYSVLLSSIEDWLRTYISKLIQVPKDEIRDNIPFAEYGLDSTAAAGLTADLSDWLGIHIEADIVKRHRTIKELSGQVVTLAATREIKP